MKRKLLERSVRILKESFPDVNETNIFSGYVYSECFKKMLKDAKTDAVKLVRHLWIQVDEACDELMSKIANTVQVIDEQETTA